MDSAWGQKKLEATRARNARHSQSLDCIAEGPAIWRPAPYQNWTSLAPYCVRCSAGVTSEQTMTFQDTPRFVRRLLSESSRFFWTTFKVCITRTEGCNLACLRYKAMAQHTANVVGQ